MAYGRFDVFWPDGQFKTYQLVEPNISVGRSSGNTIMLDTNTISRYHFSITHDGEQVYITDLDSANGTFVDGVRLPTNQARALYGGEEILIGHLRIIYHPVDESPTQPLEAVEDVTQRIELSLPTFRIDIQGPDQLVAPGAHISAYLSIVNTGQERQTYTVEVNGLPKEWVRVDRRELEIAPDQTGQVVINFKPLRRSDSKPGDYPVRVRVALKDHPDQMLEADVILRVLAYGGFGMALENRRIASGEHFRLHLHNQGSANLPISVVGRDQTEKLAFKLNPAKILLSPGQRMVLKGEVRARRHMFFGNSRQHAFDVIVRSNDHAGFVAAVRGYFLEKPSLPLWALYLGAVALAVMVVGIIAGLAILLRPAPRPNIAAFAVNSTLIAQGDPLILNWMVTDVAEINVSVNETPVVSQIDPRNSPGIEVDTSGLSGEAVVAIIGRTGDLEDTASQSVTIFQPLRVDEFIVEPAQLIRYVEQPLSLRWDVAGAVTTRISGLEMLEGVNLGAIQPSYSSQGEITGISGIPQDTFPITLYAEGETGNTLEETITVEVVNPQCTPVRDSVELRSGPHPAYQVVGTVPSGVTVVVDAQDEGGQWLRVPGEVTGWGLQSDFTCNFATANLRQVVVPTPTASPTLSPAPTRTPTRVPPTSTPQPTAASTNTPSN